MRIAPQVWMAPQVLCSNAPHGSRHRSGLNDTIQTSVLQIMAAVTIIFENQNRCDDYFRKSKTLRRLFSKIKIVVSIILENEIVESMFFENQNR